MDMTRKPMEGKWLKRAGQKTWRVISIHVNNDYANKKRGDCRKMLADLICLALRDETEIVTGDFNQAGSYIEEIVFNAVMYHEKGEQPPTRKC